MMQMFLSRCSSSVPLAGPERVLLPVQEKTSLIMSQPARGIVKDEINVRTGVNISIKVRNFC